MGGKDNIRRECLLRKVNKSRFSIRIVLRHERDLKVKVTRQYKKNDESAEIYSTIILCCSHYTKGTQWTHPRTGRKKIVDGGMYLILTYFMTDTTYGL